MAPALRKRKASTALSDPHQKRQKPSVATGNSQEYWEVNWDPKLAEQGLEKGEFPAKYIVAEDRHKGFLVRWEGTDEDGCSWRDTWVSFAVLVSAALSVSLEVPSGT